MERKEELLEYVNHNESLTKLIEHAIYLEEQLDYLMTLPKVKIHPKDNSKQKLTPAARLYREYLHSYVDIIKTIQKQIPNEGEEDSPLKKWLDAHEV